MFLSLANKWDFYFDRYQNKIEYKIKFIKYKSVYFTDFFVSLNDIKKKKWILNFLFLIILENIMVNIYLIAAIVMVVLFTQTK